MNATVLVLVGTDHHPFDRLVAWADECAQRDPGSRWVVQHGSSRPPTHAEAHAFLPHDDLVTMLADADAVVCHGGPGTIMDARGLGHVPVCVPRDPALGEHVDGHQQRFASLVDRAGVVVRADSAGALDDAVRQAASRRRETAGAAHALAGTGDGPVLGSAYGPVALGLTGRPPGQHDPTALARELLAQELDELIRDHAPRARSWIAPRPRSGRRRSLTRSQRN
ncbi:glycosyltransferase [Nocardioides taihuensis]|uniref:Glycosyltransferase n=1 Tax=Nocardioides taihuensis TaxID=1835606 RepID=A0ABW0BKX2_9ACTN